MSKAPTLASKFFDGKSMNLLSGSIDRYKGITICDTLEASKLGPSLAQYKKDGLRSVWLKIPKSEMHLAGVATQEHNFDIHHAKPDYLMLTKWLDPTSESRLPDYCTHYIGVGGMVMNQARTKLLCI